MYFTLQIGYFSIKWHSFNTVEKKNTHLEVVGCGSEHNFKWLKKLDNWLAKG